jgi:hypothetical protein
VAGVAAEKFSSLAQRWLELVTLRVSVMLSHLKRTGIKKAGLRAVVDGFFFLNH